ncbi:two component transcriptional regulator, LytTR family [Pedobacter suwonensis]|uniref:Two component transcriptional regulator, LytTR family n=1 Tax=Pedobacter suwonensis TaxID=332999 RepID=A0A1I0TQP9_9SPHI|nr:LytTR family DNA-binding domain-containing protein [Pedobacter suwonensis]SFA54131.1 two component transcriptional regulator, LytTR family [Pedobacter suwonensis]
MVLSCVIIDDDLSVLQQMEQYIDKIPFLTLKKSYSDPNEAVNDIIKKNELIDILFTDVEMPGLSGIALSDIIRKNVSSLVVVSAHTKYAVDGYNVNAKQFLTKPFNFNKFETIVNNLVNKIGESHPYIMIRLSAKGEMLKVYLDEIIAIEGASNYIKIHTLTKVVMPYYTMAKIEEKLNLFKNFKRINKSFIISAKQIEKINGDNIELKKGLVVTVSRSYKNNLKSFLSGLSNIN